jgi:arabinogalactan endo-1,4-beta-galactosidase
MMGGAPCDGCHRAANRIVVRQVAFFAFVVVSGVASAAGGVEFMAGADISALQVLEGRGAVYRNNGVAGDAIEILRDEGANWFRLRLFVNPNPATDPFVANNLSYTIA